MAPTVTQQGPSVGSMFGMPGFSRPTEQRENNDQTAFTLNQGSQKVATGLQPFMQTDIINNWRLEVSAAVTPSGGSGSLALTDTFPYSIIGPLQLAFQNQFYTIDLKSGFHAAIFQSYRGYHRNETLRNLLDTNYGAWPYTPVTNSVSSGSYTTSSTTVSFVLDLPGALLFDRYYELDINGKPLFGPVRTWVTPQYMAGTARIITPRITFNQLLGGDQGSGVTGTQDIAPYYSYGTQSPTPATVTGTATLGFARLGYYQPTGPADSPAIYNWQYTRKSDFFSLAGRTTATIPLTNIANGQILSVWVYLFDPSATVNSKVVGAPITINSTNITSAQLVYGSGLYRYQDTVESNQYRFGRQHGFLPPQGVLAWDMALNELGEVTNGDNVLNTMTTSGISIKLNFGSALSSTAYAAVGVEALQYVEPA